MVDRKNILIFTTLIGILVWVSFMILGTFAFSAMIDKNIELPQSYSFSDEWGSKGTADGKFLRPHDLEFDHHEKYLYIADRDGNRIQVFDKNGTFLFKFGQKGHKNGEFLVPYGIDVDTAGNVWVADRGNHRIQKFDSHGNFILKFGNKDSHPSNKPGEFAVPTTIEQDAQGNFFVNERGNERVQKFDANWNPILMWGSKGSGDNQFCHMEHIALDKYDNVYVTDPQSDPECSKQPRVLKFDNNGKFITKFGSYGTEPGRFIDPEHLAIDNEGDVYVSDRSNNKILVFSPVSNSQNGCPQKEDSYFACVSANELNPPEGT